MLTLHYFPLSCSFVPHVALEWSGLPYQGKEETRTSVKEPAFLKLNPMGQVPLLEDGDFVLAQNVAIIQYVHELAPQAGIFTHGDAKQQAKARQWLLFAKTELHRLFSLIFGAARCVDDEAAQQALAAKARETITRVFSIVDSALIWQDFLAGEISIADIYVYLTLRWAEKLGIDLSSHSRLAAYQARVESNAGVQKILKVNGLA